MTQVKAGRMKVMEIEKETFMEMNKLNYIHVVQYSSLTCQHRSAHIRHHTPPILKSEGFENSKT